MSKKYRILRIINRFNLGGPTYNVAYLTKYLSPQFETLLVGGQKDASEESSSHILDQLNITPTIIGSMHRSIHPLKDYKSYKEIDAIIKSYKPHIVHTHASKSGTLGRLAAHHNNVPVIVHTFHGHVFHNYFGKFKTSIFKEIERYLAKRTTKIVALSEIQQEELTAIHKIASKDKFAIVPLGFDLDKFTLNFNERRDKFRALYAFEDRVAIGIIGRLVPIKNHKMFLNGIHSIKQKAPYRAVGVIIGDGELKNEIFNYCKELGLNISFNKVEKNTDILFLSWIKKMHELLPALDIVALTSLNEGTPVSLIEAQAAGIPVISTEVGGVRNIVFENQSALLCQPNQQVKFNELLNRMVFEKGLLSGMKNKGQSYVLENFHFRKLVENMENLYLDLLKSKGI